MIEVKFGKEYSANPTGGFEQYGTSDKILIGEFIDFINLEGKTYLFTKVIEAFPSAELNEGDIYVIEALADIYANGYAKLFLNSGNKDFCRKLEKLLNSKVIDNLLNSEKSLKEIVKGNDPTLSFKWISSNDQIITTEINEDVFEEKKEMIKLCNQTCSTMQSEIKALQKVKKI